MTKVNNAFLHLPTIAYLRIDSCLSIEELNSLACVCIAFAQRQGEKAGRSGIFNLFPRVVRQSPAERNINQETHNLISVQQAFSGDLRKAFYHISTTTLNLAIPRRLPHRESTPRGLPRSESMPALHHSFNPIPEIRHSFPNCHSLTLFDTLDHPLSPQDLSDLFTPPSQSESRNIARRDFVTNSLTSLHLSITNTVLLDQNLAKLLQALPSLKGVGITICSPVLYPTVAEIGKLFSSTKLTSLRIQVGDSFSFKSPFFDPTVFSHLASITTLRSLSITGSFLDLKSIEHLSPLPSLQSLTWGEHEKLDGVVATRLWARNARNLVKFSCVNLEADFDQVFSECLGMSSLKRVFVRSDRCKISALGFTALGKHKTLVELDLQIAAIIVPSNKSNVKTENRLSIRELRTSSLTTLNVTSIFSDVIATANSIASMRHLTLYEVTAEDLRVAREIIRKDVTIFAARYDSRVKRRTIAFS